MGGLRDPAVVCLRQCRCIAGGAGAQYLGDGFCAVVAGIGLASVLAYGLYWHDKQQALADERGDEVAGSFDDLIRARAAEGTAPAQASEIKVPTGMPNTVAQTMPKPILAIARPA